MKEGVAERELHYHLDLQSTRMEIPSEDPPPIWDGQRYASTLKTGAPDGPP